MMKTDHPGFIKDDTPGLAQAVLNIDNASYKSFKEKRAKELKLREVANDVNVLKRDMGEIKNMLANLIDGLNGKK